jgi:hypothetical protein
VDGAPVNLELCDAGSEENTQSAFCALPWFFRRTHSFLSLFCWVRVVEYAVRWVLLVDAVVLVYSVTDRASFEAMEDWRKRILQTKAGVPIMLV